MATDSPGRIALSIVLVLTLVSSYRDDEPVQIEITRDGQRQTITGRGR